eukprot:scaffold4168_cov50-Prasinocladus_malaysianus.AAC.1
MNGILSQKGTYKGIGTSAIQSIDQRLRDGSPVCIVHILFCTPASQQIKAASCSQQPVVVLPGAHVMQAQSRDSCSVGSASAK